MKVSLTAEGFYLVTLNRREIDRKFTNEGVVSYAALSYREPLENDIIFKDNVAFELLEVGSGLQPSSFVDALFISPMYMHKQGQPKLSPVRRIFRTMSAQLEHSQFPTMDEARAYLQPWMFKEISDALIEMLSHKDEKVRRWGYSFFRSGSSLFQLNFAVRVLQDGDPKLSRKVYSYLDDKQKVEMDKVFLAQENPSRMWSNALTRPNRYGLTPVRIYFGQVRPYQTQSIVTGDVVELGDGSLRVFVGLSPDNKPWVTTIEDWDRNSRMYKMRMADRRRFVDTFTED